MLHYKGNIFPIPGQAGDLFERIAADQQHIRYRSWNQTA